MSPGVEYLSPDEEDDEPSEEPAPSDEEAPSEEASEAPEEISDEERAAEEAAAAAAAAQQARVSRIVAHVRAESRDIRLTDPDIFLEEPFGYDDEQLAQVWVDLAEDEQYKDIVFTRDARTGIEYLHSDVLISAQYATLMLRTKANDPVYLIAETVREHSEIYPQPIRYELFEWEPFKLSTEEILAAVEAMQADPEYSDIKPFEAVNGVPYLFSERYMTAKAARRNADYNEVDS